MLGKQNAFKVKRSPFKGSGNPVEIEYASLLKGVYSYETFALLGNKFLPYREDPFPEGTKLQKKREKSQNVFLVPSENINKSPEGK